MNKERTIQGELFKIMDSEQKSEKFTLRNFILKTRSDYPEYITFQLHKRGKVDNINLLKNFKEGDIVEVSYNIKGREYNGKYFNTLEAWRVASYFDQVSNGDQNPDRDLKEELPF